MAQLKDLLVNGNTRMVGSLYCNNSITGAKVYNAVWNDLSDSIEIQDSCPVEPGFVYYFDGNEYHKTSRYCQKGIIGIHSDTAGFNMGRKGRQAELDIAVAGFVLAYVDGEYDPGTPLTSAPNGHLIKMKMKDRALHPERIVGTYWKKEPEEYWGPSNNKIKVNGRSWIKIK